MCGLFWWLKNTCACLIDTLICIAVQCYKRAISIRKNQNIVCAIVVIIKEFAFCARRQKSIYYTVKVDNRYWWLEDLTG